MKSQARFAPTLHRRCPFFGNAPDNYVVYDRNIMGPRGRFGTWVFGGSASFQNGWGGNFICRGSYVGCTLFESDGRGGRKRGNAATWDSVAVQYAGVEIREKAAPVGDTKGHEGQLFFHEDEKSAATVIENAGSVAGRHRLGKNWEVREAWLFTPTRMIGLVACEATADNECVGVNGYLKLLGSRYRPTPEFEKPAKDTFKFGGLNIRYHEQTFGSGVSVERDNAEGLKRGYIVLMDSASAADKQQGKHRYTRGTKYHYLVELRPETSTPAASIKRLDLKGGLLGFDVDEGSAQYRLVFNPTEMPLQYADDSVKGKRARAYRSGAQFRPSWMNTYVIPDQDIRPRLPQWGEPVQDPKPEPLESVRLTIPPCAHLLMAFER